jgi:hypothetical protein
VTFSSTPQPKSMTNSRFISTAYPAKFIYEVQRKVHNKTLKFHHG